MGLGKAVWEMPHTGRGYQGRFRDGQQQDAITPKGKKKGRKGKVEMTPKAAAVEA